MVIRESLQGCIRDVESIKRDIVENIQNIVEGMEMAPFKVIIGKYKEKLEVFQNLLEEYKKYIIVCRIERLSNCKMIRLRFYRTSHLRNLNWIYITSSAPH